MRCEAQLPFSHINLRRNPFGEVSRADAADLAVIQVDLDPLIQRLRRPGFAVQFIDTARLDWQLNKSMAGGNEIRMGVEVTPDGRPVNYYFLNHDPTESLWGHQFGPGTHTKVPASRGGASSFSRATRSTWSRP